MYCVWQIWGYAKKLQKIYWTYLHRTAGEKSVRFSYLPPKYKTVSLNSFIILFLCGNSFLQLPGCMWHWLLGTVHHYEAVKRQLCMSWYNRHNSNWWKVITTWEHCLFYWAAFHAIFIFMCTYSVKLSFHSILQECINRRVISGNDSLRCGKVRNLTNNSILHHHHIFTARRLVMFAMTDCAK
jgi:hypothetical protein